jgi:hypothetical protein
MEGSTPGFSQLGLEGGRPFSGVLPDALDVLWQPAKNFDRFGNWRPRREAEPVSCGDVAIGRILSRRSHERILATVKTRGQTNGKTEFN